MAGFNTSRASWLSHLASVAAVACAVAIGVTQTGTF